MSRISYDDSPQRMHDFDIELKLLLEAIYLKYQHDFRRYSMSSLRRRLMQALDEFGVSTLSQLQDRIMRNEADFVRLFHYLTVQVSDMFRDPDYFLALRNHVLPVLQTYPSIKVWVAGCSTGEELWSLKILFDEAGLTGSFDHVFNSAETGIPKPEARAYLNVVAALGVPPSATAFIDDHPPNVAGAIDVGMIGHHYVGLDELRFFLRDHELV